MIPVNSLHSILLLFLRPSQLLLTTLACLTLSLPLSAEESNIMVRLIAEIGHDDKGPQLRHPSAVVTAEDQTIFVLDGVNNRVVAYSENGGFLYSFGRGGNSPGALDYPLGMTMDAKGNIYIADTGNARIQIFSRQGKYLEHIDLPHEPGFTEPDPTDVAVDDQRRLLYVVDNDNHRLLIYDLAARKFLPSVGQMGHENGHFRYPFSIYLDAQGTVYVVDVINTVVRTIYPDDNWRFDISIGNYGVEKGEVYRPKGVAVDKNGNVYISDSFIGVVQVFGRDGRFRSALLHEDGGVRRFITPTRLHIDRKGRLYVVEMYNHRISILEVGQ